MNSFRKHYRPHLLWILAIAALLASFTSCGSDVTPVLNPDPKHIVKITGRLPPSLDVELIAGYSIQSGSKESLAKDGQLPKECMPDVVLPWVLGPGMLRKYFKEDAIKINRIGDRYEAIFVVDKYLPGKCRWAFDGIGYGVKATGNRRYANQNGNIVNGHTFYHPDYRYNGLCDGVDEETCHKRANALDTPVVVICEMAVFDIPPPPAPEPDKTPYFTCGSKSNLNKREHFLMPDSKQVRVDFYDLDVDPDPTP